MRGVAIVLASALALGCSRHPPPAPASDASPPRAPEPDTLALADEATHTVNAVVLVVGDGAERALAVIADSSTMRQPKRIGTSYVEMPLGKIRDWTTRVHVYAFADANAPPPAKDLARTDGIILVEYADGRSAWAEGLTSHVTKPSGERPTLVRLAPASDADVVPAFKEVTKAALLNVKAPARPAH